MEKGDSKEDKKDGDAKETKAEDAKDAKTEEKKEEKKDSLAQAEAKENASPAALVQALGFTTSTYNAMN